MIQVKFCVYQGAWRFLVRFAGRTRVIGPACHDPVSAWVTWNRYRDDALPEAMR